MRARRYDFSGQLVHGRVAVGAGDKMFATRISELLERAKRLAEQEAEGYRYRKVRVKATRVKAHRRRAYTVMRAVRPR